jgi:hypothetical protein
MKTTDFKKTGAPSASLILTVPAYSFVVALHLDCLGRFNRATFSTETFAAAKTVLEASGFAPRSLPIVQHEV